MAVTPDGLVSQWKSVRPDLDPSPMRLTSYVARFSHHSSNLIDTNLSQHGLQQWQFDVLATLRRVDKPLTAKQLAESTLITASALTNRVEKLVDSGLINREVNPASRREFLITLTPRGMTLIDEILPSHIATCEQVAKNLTSEEAKKLGDLIRKALGE